MQFRNVGKIPLPANHKRGFMKFREKFSSVIIILLGAMFGCFTGILAVFAAFYTNKYPEDYVEGFVDTFKDNPFINILVLFLVVGIFFGLAMLFRKFPLKEKTLELLAVIISGLLFILLLIWVYKCKCAPVCDQLQLIYDAVFFKHGNFEDMNGYLRTFPQQFGLVFLEEICMRIKEDYRPLQYLNAFFVSAGIYASYRISKEMFKNSTAAFMSLLFSALFAPIYFYANFVYGEVPSIAFSLYGIWLLLLFLRKKKIVYAVFSVLLLSLAYVARTNVIILLIALCLSLLIYGIREKKISAFILAPVVLILPLLCNAGIKKSYEIRSGITLADPQPALAWIAMGMMQSDQGYGFCNDYANNTFNTIANYDAALAKDIYREYISERTNEFKADPSSAKTFYRMKLIQQWNEGTFSSIVNTNAFENDTTGVTIRKIYSAELGDYVTEYCNRYTFVVYALFFAYAVLLILHHVRLLLRNRKNQDSGPENTGLDTRNPDDAGKTEFAVMDYFYIIYFIGGFLFSLLWEAKPRYVFPYFYICLPLAAVSLYRITTFLTTWISRLLHDNKRNGDR